MKYDAKKHCGVRSGFTLIELVSLIAVVVVLTFVMLQIVSSIQSRKQATISALHLHQLGVLSNSYIADHGSQIYSYTWRAGQTYRMADMTEVTPADSFEAAELQSTDLIMRFTGRVFPNTRVPRLDPTLTNVRYTHLVLFDYGASPGRQTSLTETFVDPADKDLLGWYASLADPTLKVDLPYARPPRKGYDTSTDWSKPAVQLRWAWGSSYQCVPYAWQADGPTDILGPSSLSPHQFQAIGTPTRTVRKMQEVAFPAQKVHLYEEFDREKRREPYFAYDRARPEKLMFDGSINSQPSGEAHDSVNPDQPGQVWKQRYVPLDTFPIPMGGFNDNRLLNMRYRWTEGGLQGVDYD